MEGVGGANRGDGIGRGRGGGELAGRDVKEGGGGGVVGRGEGVGGWRGWRGVGNGVQYRRHERAHLVGVGSPGEVAKIDGVEVPKIGRERAWLGANRVLNNRP